MWSIFKKLGRLCGWGSLIFEWCDDHNVEVSSEQ